AANETATRDDIARMAEIVQAGVAAGAIGLSVNRLELHKAKDGREVPGTFAELDEILALAHAVAAGSPDAVFSTILPQAAGSDRVVWDAQIDWISRLSRETGLAVTFPFGASTDGSDAWRSRLARIEGENTRGARLVPQVGSHRQGLLCGLRTLHPFLGRPSYSALTHLPVHERAARMADGSVKAAILAERATPGAPRLAEYMLGQAGAVFPSAPLPDQEPDPATSLAAQAAARGRDPEELLYDWTVAEAGDALVHFFLGGYPGSLDASLELMAHPDSVLGLCDGGAHVDVICDCGYPSFVLSYWVRERARGTLSLETAIRVLTSEPARLFGLHDRGVIAPGLKADLNVLDADAVAPHPVEVVHDLPTGAKRILQRSDGFVATVVSGEVVQRQGNDTGARPGRVVRPPLART
ncbi:MAG: amidohydrolase family protein, partial [Actinomycetota bacterium]